MQAKRRLDRRLKECNVDVFFIFNAGLIKQFTMNRAVTFCQPHTWEASKHAIPFDSHMENLKRARFYSFHTVSISQEMVLRGRDKYNGMPQNKGFIKPTSDALMYTNQLRTNGKRPIKQDT